MAIANAAQRGGLVYVYNEKASLIFTIPSGSGPKDGLKGYTSGGVNVQRGSLIYMYNDRGSLSHTVPG
jgi:hypothetical protein